MTLGWGRSHVCGGRGEGPDGHRGDDFPLEARPTVFLESRGEKRI